HETVGGLPTVAGSADMVAVAKACGYQYAASVADFAVLDAELVKVKEAKQLSFLEVKCAIGAREDLGRPTTTAMDNKRNFMKFLQER
ncbi:MAG: phosphonopyruvate decarboxylase, partial [Anaerovibrio sp.]|nr:phosphonopyruvate decarboxylase [Anaerovibrio sp.]